jgi:hypothetical protein
MLWCVVIVRNRLLRGIPCGNEAIAWWLIPGPGIAALCAQRHIHSRLFSGGLEKLESMHLQERALVPRGYAREVVDFHVPHSRTSSLLTGIIPVFRSPLMSIQINKSTARAQSVLLFSLKYFSASFAVNAVFMGG